MELPSFPLQLLISDYPEWRGHPVAVVADDRPQARVTWVDEMAHRLGILPGLRYAAALALSSTLRAGVVTADRVARGVTRVLEILQRFTPGVEPDRTLPGTFFLDAEGLGLLGSGDEMGYGVWEALREVGFVSRVVLGWTRLGTLAISRMPSTHRVVTLPSLEVERARTRRVPLLRLPMEAKLRDGLNQLGITTLGAFLDLPPAGVRSRFGDDAFAWHRRARGELEEVFEPAPISLPLMASVDLDHPETDAYRLLGCVRGLIHRILPEVVARDESVRAVTLRMKLDRGDVREEHLRPAEPTNDVERLLELVRLRFNASRFSSGVVEITLNVEGTKIRVGQGELFAERPRRDDGALQRALARLRAEFGEDAVTQAEVREAHLPEATFGWVSPDRATSKPRTKAEPETRALFSTAVPDVTQNGSFPMVRRVLERPLSAVGQPRHGHDHGWPILGDGGGSVVTTRGPYQISGGWWRREVSRAYHWIETQHGRWLWAFYDEKRLRWYVQGELL